MDYRAERKKSTEQKCQSGSEVTSGRLWGTDNVNVLFHFLRCRSGIGGHVRTPHAAKTPRERYFWSLLRTLIAEFAFEHRHRSTIQGFSHKNNVVSIRSPVSGFSFDKQIRTSAGNHVDGHGRVTTMHQRVSTITMQQPRGATGPPARRSALKKSTGCRLYCAPYERTTESFAVVFT